MTMLRRILSVLALLTMAACGGGGGSAGTSTFGGGSGGGTGAGTPTASDLVLALSSSTISNSGVESVTATATALDGSRNALVGVPVVISVDSNAIATPSGTITNDVGKLLATVSIGADTSLRTITVTATSGSLTRTAALQVQTQSGATGQASLSLTTSSSTVTATAPATVSVTLRNAQSAPVAGQVIVLASVRGLSIPSVNSVLTDNNGVASFTVRPAAGDFTGADEIQASTSVVGSSGANVALSASVGYTVMGASPTISVQLSPASTTLRASTSPVDFSATVRNEQGDAVANQLVTFRSAGNLLTLNPASALTDANGRALTRLVPTSAATNAADVITASTSLAGRDLQSGVSVQLVAEVPSMELTLNPGSNVSTGSPVTARALVRDAAGVAVVGTVVSFSSQFNLAAFNPATVVTDSNGVASTAVSPRLATSAGADVLRATATVAGISRMTETNAQFTGSVSGGTPVLDLTLSTSSISGATPATVTATLKDAAGNPVGGQVITFNVVRGLASTNVGTALTASTSGQAVVVLTPTSATSAGADEVTASVNYAGTSLSATRGFQVQATSVTLDSLTAAENPLSAYGQTTLTLGVTGASVASPVSVTLMSACVSQGKATLSPSTLNVTSAITTSQYRDNGCGAILNGQPDQVQAVVTSTGTSRPLALTIDAPADSSIAFVSAAPEQIFLRGSGFTESSIVTFEVRDAAGNPLPGRTVELRLQTGAGGVTMESRGVESLTPPSPPPYTQVSNANGRVAVRVNSGTLPTPVRINARLSDNINIATVSSNLSVAIGLPSQLNFSFSQGTRNIEGYNIDGTPNTYQIIAADRSGNPVPTGTSINFVTEGGQIEAIKQTQIVNGIARTTANFVSAEPRPVDGRVTVTAYALGEESFLDVNGNNAYDPPGSLNLPVGAVRDAGESFQDLGRIYKDRYFNGLFDDNVDEYVTLTINDGSACAPITNPLLLLNASIPSVPGSCDGAWSGAGQVYVRRALETVLSTSGSRPLWPNSGDPRILFAPGTQVALQIGPEPAAAAQSFRRVDGDTLCSAGATGTFTILVADANPGRPRTPFLDPLTDYDQFPRLNPMAAGTTVSASTPTTGFAAGTVAGSPVPSTTEASLATLSYDFTDAAVNEGVVSIAFRSPAGVTSSTALRVVRGAAATAAGCP